MQRKKAASASCYVSAPCYATPVFIHFCCFFYVFYHHLIFWERNTDKKVQTILQNPLLKSGKVEGVSGEGRRVGTDLVLQLSLTPVLSWGALIRVPLLSSSPRNTNTRCSVFFRRSAEAEARQRPLAVVSSIEFSPYFFAAFAGGKFSHNSDFYLWWASQGTELRAGATKLLEPQSFFFGPQSHGHRSCQ